MSSAGARSLALREVTVGAPRWWPWPAALALAALTWPVDSLAPSAIPGPFTAGFQLAAGGALRWGHDVVFTYGPLAFLAFPQLVRTWAGAAGLLYAAVVHTAIVLVVLRVGLRAGRWPVALAVAAVAAMLPVPLADAPVVLALAGCAWLLERDHPTRSAWLAPAAGLVAAFELLVKLNDGLLVLALAALAVWRLRPGALRAEAALFGGFAGSTAALWLLSGNRAGDFPTWARLSGHLLLSYGQGMEAGTGFPAQLRTALLLLAALAALTVVRARRLGGLRGASLALAVALFGAAYLKEGFVRYDGWHATVFFGVLAAAVLVLGRPTPELNVAALALSAAAVSELAPSDHALGAVLLLAAAAVAALDLRPHRVVRIALLAAASATFVALYARQASQRVADGRTLGFALLALLLTLGWRNRTARLAALALVGAAVLGCALAPTGRMRALYQLRLHGGDVVAQARSLASGDETLAAKARWRRWYPLAPSVRAALRGHTVDVEPWGAALAWAYGLDWRPEPLLESYAAYDATLDRYAADALTARGAERILQLDARLAIDGQNAMWQAPALVLAELCNYRRVAASGHYVVLARAPGRCGTPRRLATVEAAPQQWVRVPQAGPHTVVYATLRLPTTLGEQLRSLAYKPTPVTLTTQAAPFTLVRGVAGDPLLMRGVTRFRLSGVSGRFAVAFYALPLHVASAG